MPVSLSAINAGVQGAIGVAQYIRGQKLAKSNKRSEYEIPDEIKKNLSQAQLMALEGLPPEQKQQYIENTQRTENAGINALGDRKAGLAGLATLTQQSNDANKNLLTADASARQENQGKLMDANTQMAGFKDKQFELNKLLPFQQTAAAAEGLKGAGIQNVTGALGSVTNTLENKAMADAYKDKTAPGAMPTPDAITTTGQPIDSGGGGSWSEYQTAKISNPALSYPDFLKKQPKKGLNAYIK